MTAPIPDGLREYLTAAPLLPLWASLRERLERNGHAVQGSVVVPVDDDGADRLAGLLGRPVAGGVARVRLAELDAALRASAAGRGLVPVVAELTGGALRNRPAEREATRAGRQELWAQLGEVLAEHGLAGQDWVPQWLEWLRRSGVLSRLPAASAGATSVTAVRVLARVLGNAQLPAGLAELASQVTGDAHGLDGGVPAAAMVLRALAFALDCEPAGSAAERRQLWQRVGVATDEISGTVITFGLRPPGGDRWSVMMRERAELGLVTHLTVLELQRAGALTPAGEIVHACENPQVLQRFAAAGVDRPVACFSGNPAAAGMVLLGRMSVRYHGDFDWPGIAIARRVFERGALPWRFGRDDYAAAVERLPAAGRLGLSGRAERTPWDEALGQAMAAADVVVHEEAIVELLLADLQ
ncbi:MAG TPA: TIGR02679 family protein [Streptosporangiaceae bacterium]